MLARIEPGGPDDCWNWPGAHNGKGYGVVGTKRPDRSTAISYVHRLAHEHWIGPIPEGYEVDHLCRNRACVNPKHLEAVSRRTNVQRQMAVITHCPHGHEYSEENTRINTDGKRDCRACDRERARAKRGTLPEKIRGPYQRRST